MPWFSYDFDWSNKSSKNWRNCHIKILELVLVSIFFDAQIPWQRTVAEFDMMKEW